MGLDWLLITVLLMTGWGGFVGWSMEHVANVCLTRNALLLSEHREGPLQQCA